MRLSAATFVAVALASVACQMPQYAPPAAPTPGAVPAETTSAPSAPAMPGGPSSASPSTSAFGSSPSKSGAPSAPIPTTVEIHSDCSKTTPVFYGEKPKFGSGTKSSIGSNTTTSQGRNSDGTLTVWIVDEQENGIASVKVTPQTKRVEIDSSCKHISAR